MKISDKLLSCGRGSCCLCWVCGFVFDRVNSIIEVVLVGIKGVMRSLILSGFNLIVFS